MPKKLVCLEIGKQGIGRWVTEVVGWHCDRAFWTILNIFFLYCAKWGIHWEVTSRGVAITKLHLKQKSKVILATMWKQSESGKTNLEAITAGQRGLGCNCGEGEKWPEWGHMLMVDLTEFADGLYVGCGKERSWDVSRFLDWATE